MSYEHWYSTKIEDKNRKLMIIEIRRNCKYFNCSLMKYHSIRDKNAARAYFTWHAFSSNFTFLWIKGLV